MLITHEFNKIYKLSEKKNYKKGEMILMKIIIGPNFYYVAAIGNEG